MKKIIFACDGNNFPEGAFGFIKDLQATEQVLLTGAFLNSINFEAILPGVFAVHAGSVLDVLEEQKENRTKSIHHFEDLCRRNDITYRVHEESMEWSIEELYKETRFADLLVMSEEIFCDDLHTKQPNPFMKQVIRHAECPVVCVPEKYTPFEKIVIAYDGKEQSMFALKQFCSLFPKLCDKETTIVYFRENEKDMIPDMSYLQEYAAAHFSNLVLEKLPFDPRKYFDSWAANQGNFLLVTGSYGRSGISTTLKNSFVNEIIETHHLPVFIAHK